MIRVEDNITKIDGNNYEINVMGENNMIKPLFKITYNNNQTFVTN